MSLLALAVAVGIAACTSEETPTGPSTAPALATIPRYTAIDLGALGGPNSYA
jgi:hypothetical protein